MMKNKISENGLNDIMTKWNEEAKTLDAFLEMARPAHPTTKAVSYWASLINGANAWTKIVDAVKANPNLTAKDIWEQFAETPNPQIGVKPEYTDSFKTTEFNWDSPYSDAPTKNYLEVLKSHGIQVQATARKRGQAVNKPSKFAKQQVEDPTMNADLRAKAMGRGWQALDSDIKKCVTRVARNGVMRTYVLYGVSGAGKSYEVYNTLRELGYTKGIDGPNNYIILGGSLGGTVTRDAEGLVKRKSALQVIVDTLMRYGTEDSPIIVLDDFVIDFNDEKTRATFLNMFETNEEKGGHFIRGVNPETGKVQLDSFEGRVIIISNQSNWSSEILDRFQMNTFYNITADQFMNKIQFLMEQWAPGLSPEVKTKVWEMVAPYAKGMKVNLRRYEQTLKALEEMQEDGETPEDMLEFAQNRMYSWAEN